MQEIKFETFTRPNGHDEVAEYLQTLREAERQKVIGRVLAIQQHGLLEAQHQKWVKKLADNLFEIRSEQSSNLQRILYFHVANGRYVMTHGFTKKTQKTPTREISRALTIREEFFDDNTIL